MQRSKNLGQPSQPRGIGLKVNRNARPFYLALPVMPDRPKIAIVDDDPSVCRALTRLIRAAGMEAHGFTSAQAFQEAFRSALPDCLVLDVQMPDINGLQLQEQLAQQKRSVPIIFITAYDDAASRARAMEHGAADFLRKPFDDQSLLNAIDLALHPHTSGRPSE